MTIRSFEWQNPILLIQTLPVTLEALSAQPEVLRASLEKGLLRIERFPNFYKLVLAELEDGTSLRLHYFPTPGIGSRHSHRWAFGALVLVGRLRHVLFEEDVVYERRAPGTEPPICSRTEFAGCSYVLWPANVHSVEALEPSLTLVVRGPEVRSTRFVDVPGVERGWARRYTNPNLVVAGERLPKPEEPAVVSEVLRLWSRDPHKEVRAHVPSAVNQLGITGTR